MGTSGTGSSRSRSRRSSWTWCALGWAFCSSTAPRRRITTFGSALFWTSTQLLTVSSSLQNPISAGGRILDVAMEAYAITVVATLAGSIGAFMVKRARELEHDAARQATQK